MPFCGKYGKASAYGKKALRPLSGLVLLAVIMALTLTLCSCGSEDEIPDTMIGKILDVVNKGTQTNYFELANANYPDSVRKAVEAFYEVDKTDIFWKKTEQLRSKFEYLDSSFSHWKVSFTKNEVVSLTESELKSFTLNMYAKPYEDYLVSKIETTREVLSDPEKVREISEKCEKKEEQVRENYETYVRMLESYETFRITEGYLVKGCYVVEMDDARIRTDEISLYVFQINGEWTVSHYDRLFHFDTQDQNYNLVSFLEPYLNRSFYTSIRGGFYY